MTSTRIQEYTVSYETEMILQKCIASNVEPDQGSTTAVLQPCNPSELPPVVGGHGNDGADKQMSSSIKEDDNDSNGPKRYRGATPVQRKRIQALVVEEHRGRVGALVRRRLASEHWEEAEHVGLIGVLAALERYESAQNDCFWAFARPFVRNEIQKWLDHGVYWRPRSRKVRDPEKERVARDHRQCVSMDAGAADDSLHDVLPSPSPTAEALLSNAELTVRLRRFVATLHPSDIDTLFSKNARSRRTRRYLVLTRRAAAFVKGKDFDVPTPRVRSQKNNYSPAGSNRK